MLNRNEEKVTCKQLNETDTTRERREETVGRRFVIKLLAATWLAFIILLGGALAFFIINEVEKKPEASYEEQFLAALNITTAKYEAIADYRGRRITEEQCKNVYQNYNILMRELMLEDEGISDESIREWNLLMSEVFETDRYIIDGKIEIEAWRDAFAYDTIQEAMLQLVLDNKISDDTYWKYREYAEILLEDMDPKEIRNFINAMMELFSKYGEDYEDL